MSSYALLYTILLAGHEFSKPKTNLVIFSKYTYVCLLIFEPFFPTFLKMRQSDVNRNKMGCSFDYERGGECSHFQKYRLQNQLSVL